LEGKNLTLKNKILNPETSGQDDSKGGTPIPKLSQSDHFVAGLGVIVALIPIITISKRINKTFFELFRVNKLF